MSREARRLGCPRECRPLVHLEPGELLEFVRRHLSYANVVATLALFLVVSGGAAYAATHLAKNSVGTKQIKNGAVTTAKLGKGAVTGAKIAKGTVTGANVDVGSLGPVPSATHADSATNAGHADSASSATTAGHADSATDASTLQGMTAAQVAASDPPRCPEGSALAVGLCFETTVRTPAVLDEAIAVCGKAGRLLPSMTELTTYIDVTNSTSVGQEWVGQPFYDGSKFLGISISLGSSGSETDAELVTTPLHYRCAVPPAS